VTASLPENYFQFEKLLAALAREGIDFAVAGGVAISLNGFIRATDDVDIIVHEAPANIEKLLQCLRGWGEGFARELSVADFVPQEGSIRLVEEFELDIFTRMKGKSLDDFRPRLRSVPLGGVEIRYLGPEDLILLKKDSWREKDKVDVAAMRRVLEG
jgi:predicted nucleotidyltransferase